MRASRVVGGALVAAFLVIFVVTVNYPSIDDLFVENPGWNGLSEMYGLYRPYRLDSLSDWATYPVSAVNSTLFIIGPSSVFSESDVIASRVYLGEGGRIVLMDDFGTGNQLLEGLDVGSRFDSLLLQDPLFYEDEYVFPVIMDVLGVDEVLLNYPTRVRDSGGSVVASSSPFSYLSEEEGSPGEDTHADSYSVVVRHMVGDGALFIVSDSSVFINSMIGKRGNEMLLGSLVRGDVLVDESHIIPSRLTRTKYLFRWIYGFFGQFEVRYVFLGIFGVVLFKLKWGTESTYEQEDPVDAVMARHPGWDRALVARLHLMREKDGIREDS